MSMPLVHSLKGAVFAARRGSRDGGLRVILLAALRRGWSTLVAWQRRAEMRQQLRYLDARLLRDMGLTREDVLRETGKPFWRD